MINLRPYQKDAINQINETFKTHTRQYIEMPTGSGKTITFLFYAKEYHKRAILIIVPSKDILNQVYNTSLLFWKEDEISRKGDNFDEKINIVHICIINSIRGDYLKTLSKYPFNLIVIDEAHHSQSKSYKSFINARSLIYHELNNRILGVTATPDRLDGKLLDEILYLKSFKLSLENMISQGQLVDIEGYRIKTQIDLSGIDSHNHDFSNNELYKSLSVDFRNRLIFDTYLKHLKNRKTLIFCINIKHSKEVCKIFIENGISCSHIDGKMNRKKRHSILSSFRNGEISVLCNSNLLIEGFDEPSIDGIVLARPTKSKSFFLQMIGRGLRLYRSKTNCIIVDIVDNHKLKIGFNSIISDEARKELDDFKSVEDVRLNIGKQTLELTEFTIERIDSFLQKQIDDKYATDSMIEYFETNNIYYQNPLSFDDGSFIIWFDKLKKEFYGANKKKN